MKKLFAMMLAAAMCLSLCVPAFASEESRNDIGSTNLLNQPFHIVYTEDTGNGYLCVLSENGKVVTIITYENQGLVDVSIKYYSQPNIVYQWTAIPYHDNIYDVRGNSLWSEIIAFVETAPSKATAVEFVTVENAEDELSLSTRSSITRDLMAALEECVGEEYSNQLFYQGTHYGLNFRIYEDMTLAIHNSRSLTWSSAINVASFITAYLGLTATTNAIASICNVFGIAFSLSALIPAGSAREYICRAQVCRYVTINGGTRIYTATYKNIDYKGLDDGDPYSTAPADIVNKADPIISFGDGESYFNSSIAQVQDAYVEYVG